MSKLSSGKRAKREQSKIKRKNERKSKKQAAHYLRFGPKGTTSSNQQQKIRRGPEWGKSKTNHHKDIANSIKVQKFQQATERQEYRDSLSPNEQLTRLDTRLGKGIGALKERARLQKLMLMESTTTYQDQPVEVVKEKVKAKIRNKSKA